MTAAPRPEADRSAHLSVAHPVAVAIGLFVVYVGVVVVVWRLNGVRYDAIFASRTAIVRGIIVPIGIGAGLLAAATTWLGWWHAVLFEGSRSGPAWALVVPVMFGAAALTGARQIDFTSPKARALPLLAIAVVIVGFAEEVATRGLLIVGPRDAGWSAVAVFFLSTGLFALLYGVNALFGQSARLTLVQVGVSFLAGAALYVTRMTTGTLLVCIVLHALWDFTTGGTLLTEGRQKASTAILGFGSYAIGVVALWFVIP